MIDRYTLFSASEELSERFGVEKDDSIESEYNSAPTKRLPVIANIAREGLSHFYWGITTKWSNKRAISSKLINASIEEIPKKATLKSGIESRRCIIPANGFYLWKTVGKKSKRPYYFQLKEQPLFGMAGVWEDYDDLDGKTLHTFRLITTGNQLGLPEFGDIMPAILDKKDEKQWLESNEPVESILGLIEPLRSTSAISFHPVSPFINNIDYNFPEMIKIQPSVDQTGNYTLFE